MPQLSVLAGLMCSYEPAAADMVPEPAEGATQGRKKALSGFIVVIVVATDKCLCVNGFPDSPVCISVSQLRCGDFLTLIAPLCSVCTLLGTRGCWVRKKKKKKHTWCSVMESRAPRGLYEEDDVREVGGLHFKKRADRGFLPGYWKFEHQEWSVWCLQRETSFSLFLDGWLLVKFSSKF